MTVRITGLSSGMDVDAMVKTLMKAEQGKKDKLVQQQTSLQWKQEAYRDVSTSLVDFRQNKMSNYNLNSILTAKKADVTGNTSAVSVTSTDSTFKGNLSVTVNALAQAAVNVYDTKTPPAASTDPALGELFGGTYVPGVNASDAIKLTVNGKDFNFTKGDTISSVISKINADKSANATVMYAGGKLSVSNNNTGDFSSVQKNATLSVDGASQTATSTIAGSDAKYTVNGLAMTSSTNNVTVNGANMQLKSVSGSGGASVISSSVDTDKIVNAIKSFITDYNAILDQVNGKLKEAVYRKYQPLTQEEEDAMSDKQVELWESKAKSGLLSNDSTLSSMISSMRSMMVTGFDDGKGNKISLQSIGITTGQWTDYGKLVIGDEKKLREAIEANPDGVAKLFTATGADPKNPTSTDSGIFSKINTTVLTALQSLSTNAGTSVYSADKNSSFIVNSSVGEQLRSIAKKITDQDAYLKRKEDQYYAQFSAMETAMNKYSSQSMAFSNYS
ncbi:flagellar filament capping protein FliD [Paenibacillus sacheonensis]|uniref:Flagellar hook-associated protein 2 n=1 Tax=Paenibacillus sacheonensis TaxID=742054 RepID=A0A7X5C4B5_9BACL|nr:flagellar filament capping protein FliD [Paenibacillus sacheonensis]MBM7566472.1 flagellar hook-associated protein 2 [Paenibacillus sacheonensis]NBC73155.1 flagellar filament capping protein FliD [Paenibacillus sacheonensis]